ncbi:putative ABC transport system permease protein [Mumia flava]|uniref:Putative ABC transport system permease protein n=1 Tax=Mumia flava TaxID=1348852 RepID=A0A0B2BAW9_9ACTN|nr:ABC transporter permease [Mumia flava]PJJ53912.1 putative ABC transport system permease protein [Mumia flava]
MNWAETLRTGLEAIRHHALRSALTMLGIIIGVSSVILTVGLGQGAQDEVAEQIDALGSNLLIVSPGSSTTDGQRGGFGSATTLTLTDAQAMTDQDVVPDVSAVAPTTSSSVSLVNGTTNWTTSLVGTATAWLDVRNRTVEEGRFFTSAEAESGANVMVIGSDTAGELFTVGSPVGQTVTVDGTSFTVIGVLGSSGGSSSEASQDDTAVVPMSAAAAVTGSTGTTLSSIYVQAASADRLSAAYQEVEALLSNLHGITAADDADFTITTQESLLETANSTNKTLTVLLGGVAAISLLVGGIGVMNIMLVSVTERIREIGLRKALGATPAVIGRQFLVEASILGLTGGVVGVVIGMVGAWVLPSLIDQAVSLSVLATLAALATSLALGIGFGVYPASRAARLTPIEALRNE